MAEDCPPHCTILFTFSIICFFLCAADAQFPTVCAHNISKWTSPSKVCCPRDESGLVCGGPDRGRCGKITPSQENNPEEPKYEDRYDWPTHFVTHQCFCLRNYYGYDCSECKFGYTGKKCDTKVTLLRKNIHHVTARELRELKAAMTKSKNTISDYVTLNTSYRDAGHPNFKPTTYYDYFTYLHYCAAREPVEYKGEMGIDFEPLEYRPLDYAHNGPGLPTWHRIYLLKMERVLQKLSGNPNLTIPYWDWVGDGKECTVCTDEYFGNTDESGLLGKKSEFADFQMICSNYTSTLRKTGKICDVEQKTGLLKRFSRPSDLVLPSIDEAMTCMNQPVYDTPPFNQNSRLPSFRNCLSGPVNANNELFSESGLLGMHGRVHFYFVDVMAEFPSSPNDPVFYLHHANVDRQFEAWMRNHDDAEYPQSGAPSGHGLKSNLVPFFPVEINGDYFVTSDRLGYEFDSYDLAPDRVEEVNARRRKFHLQDQTEDISQDLSSKWITIATLICSLSALAGVVVVAARRLSRWRRGYSYLPDIEEFRPKYGPEY